MTVSLAAPGADLNLDGPADGGMAARRAVVRWAWRMFRREWRQQLLILGLIVVAVAATVVGAAVASSAPAPANSGFGTAQDMATLSGTNAQLARQIALIKQHFGPVDVIENRTLVIPGSVNSYDLRAQGPDGPFGGPLLSLVAGHYPTGPGQVAMTSRLASIFRVKVGGLWTEGGHARHVVGIVQNPQSLLDEFVLLAPGQMSAPARVTVLFDARGPIPASLAQSIQNVSSARPHSGINPGTLSIAGLTFGMLLIALVCVGGFTVVAQRRLRSLGMLASLGATDKNLGLVVRANGVVVGLVGSVLGAALGFVLWLLYRPRLESSSHHLIGVFALPWGVLAFALVIAVAATYFAASRPAHAMAKVPIVSALSGRPAPPKQVRRSAVPGLVFLAVSFLLLGYSGSQDSWGHSGGQGELVLGLVALIPAVILLSPFCLSVLARLGRRAPITVRLALRDLDRYRARSGSALAAISLGVLIAVIITIVAAARYANVLDYAGPNLAANQLVLYTPPNGPVFTGPEQSAPPSPKQLQRMGKTADDLASSLGAGHAVELASTSATLNHAAEGRNFTGNIYVATPQLLAAFGVKASGIDPEAVILTMRPGLSGLGNMQLLYGHVPAPGPGGAAPTARAHHAGSAASPPGAVARAQTFPCPPTNCVANPVIQEVRALPSGVSAPNTVITEQAVHRLGLKPTVSGWLVQAAGPLTAAEISNARTTAAQAGMSIETKNDEPTSAEVVNWATAFGIALALGILAMSVGLIRSETASDLRTLAATGASSRARRAITAATAGALALLGAVLGTVAGYVGVAGWLRSNSLAGGLSSLGNIPVANLLLILVGMPLAAIVLGWLVSGREPPAIAHQPIE